MLSDASNTLSLFWCRIYFFCGNRDESVQAIKGMREGGKDLFVKLSHRARHESLKKHGSVELQLFIDLHF